MCQIVKGHGQEIEDLGGLKAAWSIRYPVADARYREEIAYPDDGCLCPVDIAATAIKAGQTVAKRDDGDWDWL